MEFTLEDVSDDFVRQDPFIKVSLVDEEGRIEVTAKGECGVHYYKMLAAALEIIEEELTEDEQAEIDAWLDGE